MKDVGYNFLAEHLFSQMDKDGNQFRLFRGIIGHRRNCNNVDKEDQMRISGKRKVKKKTISGWALEVEWRDGGMAWIELKTTKESNAVEVAEDALANQISHEPAFDWWVHDVIRSKKRLIILSQTRFLRPQYKYGICVLRNIEETIKFDLEYGNIFWETAIAKEIMNVRVAFKFLEPCKKPAPGYKKIQLSMIFDIKMDFTRKARLVAVGHLTDQPSCLTYSLVVSRESVRIDFLIAVINGIDVIAADVQNAYVQATSLEKYYAITGDEFGEDNRKTALIVRAFYGLKSSGASWRAHIAHTLSDMGFVPSRGDPDVWMRQSFNQMTTVLYWEYILVYVDDLLAIGMEPRATLNILESDYNYVLKDFGPPTRYLGASIGTYDLNDHTKCFFMSPDQYLANAITVVQANLQKHNIKLNSIRSAVTMTPGYHPEVDTSDPLDTDAMNLYQSYVGVLRWCIELGQKDICNALGKLSSYLACPRIGHMEAVLQEFSYLSKHGRSKLVFDPVTRDWSNRDWTHPDWKEFYPEAVEQLSHDMPIPLGKPIQMNMFCDASHASDIVTHRSTAGFLIYICGTPVDIANARIRLNQVPLVLNSLPSE
jgi:hypothetical protein